MEGMVEERRRGWRRARIAQGVPVRLCAGEGGDCAGDVDSRLCATRREHRHEGLDRDPQHVAVPRLEIAHTKVRRTRRSRETRGALQQRRASAAKEATTRTIDTRASGLAAPPRVPSGRT